MLDTHNKLAELQVCMYPPLQECEGDDDSKPEERQTQISSHFCETPHRDTRDKRAEQQRSRGDG